MTTLHITLLTIVCLTLSCQPSHSSDEPDLGLNNPEPVESNFVRYRYQWSDEGITWTTDGAWMTNSNLGYEIDIEGAWVVTYSSSLVPCLGQQARRRQHPWYKRVFNGLLSTIVGSAQAGHADIADPSNIPDGFVERIGGEEQILRVGPLPATAYCDMHYLVARGDANSSPLDGAPYMDGLSIEMRGTWRKNPEQGPVPFQISSDIAFGVLYSAQPTMVRDLDNTPLLIEDGEPGLEVTFIRPMKALFDDVDFERLEGRSLARKVLYNFAATQFVIETMTMEP